MAHEYHAPMSDRVDLDAIDARNHLTPEGTP